MMEGILRSNAVGDGKVIDMVMYSLIKEYNGADIIAEANLDWCLAGIGMVLSFVSIGIAFARYTSRDIRA